MSKRKVKLIYCSCVCSEKKFQELFEDVTKCPGQQVQKYHRTLLKGFAQNEQVQMEIVSKLPISPSNYKKKLVRRMEENWSGLKLSYLPALNVSIIGNLFQAVMSFFSIYRSISKRDSVVAIDVLNISMNRGILAACALKGVKVIGIVTDLPEMLVEDKNSAFVLQGNKIISKCNAFVLLTEAMNEIVNPHKSKPYVVIEGQVDSGMIHKRNDLKDKYKERVCLYSGSLNRIHGIEYLVEGFLQANLPHTELHVYGEGDYSDELLEMCKLYRNIKYFGVKYNDAIVDAQIRATLLINPRPTNQEFVKYSFPSKNMEYMVSGTPVLTTRLPGMPAEYEPFVYILDEETSSGMCNCLQHILKESDDVLHDFGKRAKKFVLENKTGEIGAEKIVKMIMSLIV